MKHFKLNNYNLALLQEKSKLYTYLNGKLDKVICKLSGNDFIIALTGGDGVVLTNLEIEYENGSSAEAEPLYFSIDYQKWVTALLKFSGTDALHISLGDSIMRLKMEESKDVISLSLIYYEEGSQQSNMITRFISERRDEIKDFNHKITLTPELLSDFDLMNNLFSTQGRVNAIGVSSRDVLYSDRSTVVKVNLEENLPDTLFDSLSEDETYIHLHSYILKLLDILSEFNQDVWFDSDYEVLYWTDEHTEIVIASEARTLALPTPEQFEGIKPVDRNSYFDVNLDLLRTSLSFFLGFYEGEAWKPVTFILNKDEDIVLRYSRPSADITKTLTGVRSPYNYKFSVDSETLRKILQKVRDRFPGDDVFVRFNSDNDGTPPSDEAPGVYCTVGDVYEFVVSKLTDMDD